MTLDDLFQQIKYAVKYYPAQQRKCLRPATFRVLAYDQELTTENMGATICDADKPYFFSREWELNKRNPNKITAPLPAVTAYVSDGGMKDPFQKTATERTTVVLACWDRYEQEKCAAGKCSGCEARTPTEIFRDTAEILRNILFYLSGIVTATTNEDATPRLYHKALLEALVADGVIENYSTSGPVLLNMLSAFNQTIEMRPAERAADLLFGTYCTITFTFQNCATVNWNFADVDLGVLAQEAGC